MGWENSGLLTEQGNQHSFISERDLIAPNNSVLVELALQAGRPK